MAEEGETPTLNDSDSETGTDKTFLDNEHSKQEVLAEDTSSLYGDEEVTIPQEPLLSDQLWNMTLEERFLLFSKIMKHHDNWLSNFCSSQSNEYSDPDLDPLSVTQTMCLKRPGPLFRADKDFMTQYHGKWLILRNLEDLNKTWCVIREEVRSGRLNVVAVNCSTLRYDPLSHGAGPRTTGKISVYTKEEDYIEVGMKLIKLDVIKHDISYKALEVTIAGGFAHMPRMKNKRITCMTIFWNGGTPYASKDPRGPKCPAPCRNKHQYDPSEDIWKINIVQGIPECKSQPVHGKWIVESNYDATSEINITHLWHKLKEGVEEGEVRAIKMECPASRCHGDPPEIHVFTVT